MALKSFTKDEEIGDSALEEVALLSKKYKKYLRLKKKNNFKPNFSRNDHTTNKCPMRRTSKTNATKATWDYSSENEFKNKYQEEISNTCFINIDDEVKSLELNSDEFNDEFDDLSDKELLNDVNDSHRNYEKLILKNGALKKKISSLSKELEDFSKENEVI